MVGKGTITMRETRILVRFKITGHGIVYTVKITPFADDIMRK